MTDAQADEAFMRQALELAWLGCGCTSPNPMVGALLVRNRQIIGHGYHRQAGAPHAEIEAMNHARLHRRRLAATTLYVTLEPCCTHGRTPPCTEAILEAGIQRVVVAAVDPNPQHAGRGLEILRRAGLDVTQGVLETEATRLNTAFNHWIIHRTPYITVKAAMTLDGKIATARGESKWITSPESRAHAMELRRASDGIVVGIHTLLADNPSLTVRRPDDTTPEAIRQPLRIVLDSHARTPPGAKIFIGPHADRSLIVVTAAAPRTRVAALQRKARVLVAPAHEGRVDLRWLIQTLGQEKVTSLLVEGGGEVQAAFLLQGLAQAVAFFYAPKILGGRLSRKAVAGPGATSLQEAVHLTDVHWRTIGPDLLLTARTQPLSSSPAHISAVASAAAQ